jgi:PKD repeat protein
MRLLAVLLCSTIGATGCGGSSPTTPAISAPVISALSVSPMRVGIEGATQFTFASATDAGGGGASFSWQFGDGNASSAAAPVTHVYQRAGDYAAQLTVSNSAGSASRTINVRVASMVGAWVGTVTGHTGYPLNRPIPIIRFELRILQPVGTASLGPLAASWSDNAGCRESRFERIRGHVSDPVAIQFGVEQLLCNDGDLYFHGSADATANSFSGTCQQGGPECHFVMFRQ